MIKNRYLPLWLHRICNGVFGSVFLLGIGSIWFSDPVGSWGYLVSRCLIWASVPVGIILAILARSFSIVQGVAGGEGYEMIGKITSVENGPQRNVRLIITPTEVCSEISYPPGSYDPHSIDHYEVSGLRQQDHGLITLTFVLNDKRRVRFYSTEQKFDMALLLDQLDGTIGERRREE